MATLEKLVIDWRLVWEEAHAAGHAAATRAIPAPMLVSASDGAQWCVSEGACGFAWIQFPGNTEFGRWAKKTGLGRPHYPRGLSIWVRDYGQSVTRKSEYAEAAARVLRTYGVEANAGSRLD